MLLAKAAHQGVVEQSRGQLGSYSLIRALIASVSPVSVMFSIARAASIAELMPVFPEAPLALSIASAMREAISPTVPEAAASPALGALGPLGSM